MIGEVSARQGEEKKGKCPSKVGRKRGRQKTVSPVGGIGLKGEIR